MDLDCPLWIKGMLLHALYWVNTCYCITLMLLGGLGYKVLPFQSNRLATPRIIKSERVGGSCVSDSCTCFLYYSYGCLPPRFRAGLRHGQPQRPGAVGGPVRRLPQHSPVHHRPVHLPGPGQVGPAERHRAAAAPRHGGHGRDPSQPFGFLLVGSIRWLELK